MTKTYECKGQIDMFDWLRGRDSGAAVSVSGKCKTCSRFFPDRKEPCIIYRVPVKDCEYYKRCSDGG